MNPEAILALISDLVMQIHALRTRVAELEAQTNGKAE